jgi:hypothetical protein
MTSPIQKFIELNSSSGEVSLIRIDQVKRFSGIKEAPAIVTFVDGEGLEVKETIEEIADIIDSNRAGKNLLRLGE